AALSIPIRDLIDDNLLTDPTFRDRAVTILDGLERMAALLLEGNPSLVTCRSQIDGLSAAAHAQLAEDLSPVLPMNPMYYRVTDFESDAVIATGMTGSSGHLQFFGDQHRAFLVHL